MAYNCYVILTAGNGNKQCSPGYSWSSWGGGTISAFLTNVAENYNTVSAQVQANTDFGQFTSPITLYVGYGTSSDEMLSAGRYRAMYSQ